MSWAWGGLDVANSLGWADGNELLCNSIPLSAWGLREELPQGAQTAASKGQLCAHPSWPRCFTDGISSPKAGSSLQGHKVPKWPMDSWDIPGHLFAVEILLWSMLCPSQAGGTLEEQKAGSKDSRAGMSHCGFHTCEDTRGTSAGCSTNLCGH